jgi:hypothetical protein
LSGRPQTTTTVPSFGFSEIECVRAYSIHCPAHRRPVGEGDDHGTPVPGDAAQGIAEAEPSFDGALAARYRCLRAEPRYAENGVQWHQSLGSCPLGHQHPVRPDGLDGGSQRAQADQPDNCRHSNRGTEAVGESHPSHLPAGTVRDLSLKHGLIGLFHLSLEIVEQPLPPHADTPLIRPGSAVTVHLWIADSHA